MSLGCCLPRQRRVGVGGKGTSQESRQALWKGEVMAAAALRLLLALVSCRLSLQYVGHHSIIMATVDKRPRSPPPRLPAPHLPFTAQLLKGTTASTPVKGKNDEEGTAKKDAPSLPFRIGYDEASDTFLFQTATVKLSRPGLEVDLVATVHVAEAGYYAELERQFPGYDAVFYETITSRENIATDPETGRQWLTVSLRPTPELERMAALHGLSAQLNHMDPSKRPHWFLSDISREALTSLQAGQGERQLDDIRNSLPVLQRAAELTEIFWEGFTSRGLLMPKLFLRGGGWVRLLRLGLWFTPCPELQLLLLDWSRQYPPAGGLSSLLRAMLGALSRGDLVTLRRLAFSQMLTSSQKGTSTLAASTNDRNVLIGERNSKVVLDLKQATEVDGFKKVAVLYGGLHLMDLESKMMEHLGLSRVGTTWRTAWSMRAPPSESRRLVNVLCILAPLLYLAIGGFDWSETFAGIAKDVSSAADPGGLLLQDIGGYVLRHVLMYYGLTRWIVQWDRNLFDVAGKESNK